MEGEVEIDVLIEIEGEVEIDVDCDDEMELLIDEEGLVEIELDIDGPIWFSDIPYFTTPYLLRPYISCILISTIYNKADDNRYPSDTSRTILSCSVAIGSVHLFTYTLYTIASLEFLFRGIRFRILLNM